MLLVILNFKYSWGHYVHQLQKNKNVVDKQKMSTVMKLAISSVFNRQVYSL